MELPLARRAVSGFFCSTVARGALRTWGSVREGERGPADPIDAIKSRAPVGGDKVPTGEGFLPIGLLGKGGEVANLVDPSLTGKRVERPPQLRNAESSCTQDLGVSESASPHLKTDRHRVAGRWRRRTPLTKGATSRRSSLAIARRVAGEGGAWYAGSRAEAERSGTPGAGARRRWSGA